MASCNEGNFVGIGCLPDELLHKIFKLLPIQSLLACGIVCIRWRKICNDPQLWKYVVVTYSGQPSQREFKSQNLEVFNSHSHLIAHLRFTYVDNYQEIKELWMKCSNVCRFDFIMCSLGDEFIEDIKKCKHLEKLNMRNSLFKSVTNIKDLDFDYGQFKRLRYLALSDFGLSQVNCKSLLNCQYLTCILIEKIKTLTFDFIKELVIAKREILNTLHIYGGDSIDDHVFEIISQCPLLKDLAITMCDNLTDRGLKYLVNLKKILHLQLWNNVDFSEKVLIETLRSPNLITIQTLSLSRIYNVTPATVDIISEYYKGLKYLALYQCLQIVNTDYEKQLKSKFRNIDVVLY